MAAVSGLIAQFHANEAERKCSRVKKQHSDKVHKQEGSLSSCVHERMSFSPQEYKYIPASVK